MTHLQLVRPLVVLDLETTGVRPESDRIVEVALVRLRPDGGRDALARRVNPGVPIPSGASAVHGIRDADVADAPRFAEIADELLAFLGDADLAGYNIEWFDLPLLTAELTRVGRSLPLEGRAVVDALAIFRAMEPHNLAGAYRFYCGKSRDDLHSALADAEVCAAVLDAQLARYTQLPRDPQQLSARFRRARGARRY